MSTSSDTDWIEVVVPTTVALADAVAQHLVQSVEAAALGVQVRKADVVFWVDREQLEETLEAVRVSLRELQADGWAITPERVRAGKPAPEEEWRDAWKKHFHVMRLTRQFVVVPSWEKYSAEPSDIPIHLDPGQAFGTGTHASTQLVLEAIQTFADQGREPPATLFDLGTGSGILAIGAAKLWPECQIQATDIDPMSIRATIENATKNQVEEKISVSTKSLDEVAEQFPMVLANLQAHILRDLRDLLIPRLALGGDLIVSGILSSQITPLTDYYCESGQMKLVDLRASGEWSSAHLQRRAT